MPPASDALSLPVPADATLREVVGTLAAIPDRGPCTPGEREAAEWIATRLTAAGAEDAVVEDAPSWGTFPPLVTSLCLLGAAGAVLTGRGHRVFGGLASATALAGLAEEIQNGPRIIRRAVRTERKTANVFAKAGDSAAERTLVVLAHHDAAQTGLMFDQTAVAAFHERFPEVIPHIKTQPPQWFGTLAGPLLGIVAAVTGRGSTGAATGLGLASAAVIGDMWRSEIVPGANDNLSAVACLVSLAEMLRERPVQGLRVWLVSAGAEETLQDGIRGFFAAHADELDRDKTDVLCIDTVGSPRLVLLEGEGPIWMEHYDEGLRGTLADLGERHGLALERGFRARASTDAVTAMRYGYRTANLTSVNDYHYLSNYHLPTDTAENVDYSTVAEATRTAYALAAELAEAA